MSSVLRVLSHACLLIETDRAKVIFDPWLIGSCYWGSWWNYPKVDLSGVDLSDISAVFLSHIHWDHWHGPSLKKFFRNTRIYIGDDANPRSRTDLSNMGFQPNIVPHGRSVKIEDIEVFFYNFGLFLNDSAIVIETPDLRVLNANDAKLAGPSLRRVVRRHGRFDFALRSHSSANSRICYSIDGVEEKFCPDDRAHYFRAFVLFMDAVQPRFAVPFASNHCHLLPDMSSANSYISNPLELQEYIEARESDGRLWRFLPLYPGSEWSNSSPILKNQDAFFDYHERLDDYRQSISKSLSRVLQSDDRVNVTDTLVDRFWLRFCRGRRLRSLDGVRFLLTFASKKPVSFVVRVRSWEWSESIGQQSQPGVPVVVMPARVFRDAVLKNMFHHAGISKRCAYRAFSRDDMAVLQSFVAGIELKELLGDGGFRFWVSLISKYFVRWRDLVVFSFAFYYRFFRRLPLFLVEEVILARHSSK